MPPFGLYRPGRSNSESCLDERGEEGFPRFLLLVGEHHRQQAIVAQDPTALCKGVRHQALVERMGSGLCFSGLAVAFSFLGSFHPVLTVTTDVDHCFLIVFAEIGRKPLWPSVALRAF